MARSRPIEWPPKPGTRCWVDNRNTQLPLPDGLQDREEVSFVALDGRWVHVQRGDGEAFVLDARQVHVPSEIQVGGEWLPETHPTVIQAMREYMEKLKANPGSRKPEEVAEILDDMAWVIRRNEG